VTKETLRHFFDFGAGSDDLYPVKALPFKIQQEKIL